jgi:hypothetical protein
MLVHTIEDGAEFYRNMAGEMHREDGPALIMPNGVYYHFINGKCHREGGEPAVYTDTGTQYWYEQGQLHNLNGPAIIYDDGECEYWIDGIEYSETDYKKILLAKFH